MAKLIHFQGYPSELLSVTTSGIPSMHICIDFIPELLNQPQVEKQVFAIQLLSHLAIQYPIPKSMSTAKFIFDRLLLLISALPVAKRNQFFVPILPCVIRMCNAFPPLREEAGNILLKLGRIGISQMNKNRPVAQSPYPFHIANLNNIDEIEEDEMEVDFEGTSNCDSNKCNNIRTTERLDGDNPAFNRDSFLQKRTSAELVHDVESTFKTIIGLSLYDKLAISEVDT